MQAWEDPTFPVLPGTGPVPRIYDSASGALVAAASDSEIASLYVCGITPYDATHLGHAATYLAFDTLQRLWRDAGYQVRYAQNTTDLDDPLLERAARDGVDWRVLAQEQTDAFRRDMELLRIIPPDHFVAVTEVVEEIADAVARLLDDGSAYRVDGDIYFDSSAESSWWFLGQQSRLDRATMLELSAQRGGDPEREGKRDPLDPLLWRTERVGEPSWGSALGRGRPGWHIGCSVIATKHLPTPLTVLGGGSDLIFPHHEYSAGHSAALTGHALAGIYSHSGMIGYRGEKMSKSLGNLVLVSALAESGADPAAIRLALLDGHYRADREWSPELLTIAAARVQRWRAWATSAAGESTVDDLRVVLAEDLDTASALEVVERWVESEPATVSRVDAIDALLGVRLQEPPAVPPRPSARPSRLRR
ncbi:cysteine--1-D-myo-inosityl 2-amino-2-deoxy-alpha-D-glucopyranoside ligase [soil metagenome]